MTVTDTTVARAAFGRHAWAEAFEAFAAADADGGLTPEDLETMADAAWWSGHPEDATDALERAHGGYERRGDLAEAATTALLLSERAFRRLAVPVARGWLARAEHLLEDLPESPAHARLAFVHAIVSLVHDNDVEQALTNAGRAAELARRHGDAGLASMALSFTGSTVMKQGRIAEGQAMLDEAAAAATSGAIDPKAACDVYCNTIATCRALADYRRAGEWTERAERWMHRNAIGGYPGVCRVHRAELKRLRGDWEEAEREARHACEELERFRLLDSVGIAHHEVGEIRLRLGDLEGAREAFQLAYESGMDPQPGMARLLLTEGRPEEAASSLRRSLEHHRTSAALPDPLVRSQLLPAMVEIALATGDLETARSATAELEAIAGEHDVAAWTAAAVTARGAVLLAEGRADAAIPLLDDAWRRWQRLELPYESAQARTHLGRARVAVGEERVAEMELRAARSTYERLGAREDLRRVDGLLEGLRPDAGTSEGRRVTRTFMFTDIVTSTDLVELIGDGAWDQLLRWHDRALRGAFAGHRGREVKHTGDGFFVVFEDASDAVGCAVAIQRLLADHRAEHGFAPWVRIGVHTSEAIEEGDDFSGHGVHVAARVGALAGKEQILATAATLEAGPGPPFGASEPRPVTLKGVSVPVEVAEIAWR